MSTKTIRVSLDYNSNPKVLIDPIVLGKNKLRWKKEKGSADFDFFDIVFITPETNPFSNKSVKDHRIRVDNDLSAGDYSYVITVRDDAGDTYQSEKLGISPEGGRPVIRN